MRLFSVFLFALSIAAYQGWKTYLAPATPTPATCAPAPTCGGQTANVLFQSSDAGKTWQDVSRGLPAMLEITQIMARDGEVFLGTIDDGLLHSSNPAMGVWDQEQVGEMFPVTGDAEPNKLITGIFPGRSGAYVSVLDRGFFRKSIDANRWEAMHENLEDKSVYTVLERPDGTIFIGNQQGIYRTGDGGKTWEHVFARNWVNNLVAVGDNLVATGYQGLLRSTDGGKTWNTVLLHEGASYQTCVMGERIAAIRTSGSWNSFAEGAVLLRASADGGQTWEPMDESVMPARVAQLVQAGDYLFCSSSAGISRSADGGKTWELVRPYTDPREKRLLRLAVSGQQIFAVVVQAGC